MRMKILAIASMAAALAACSSDADVASRNMSKAADNFEVNRRIVFYNGITNDYMLSIQGCCSIQLSYGQNVDLIKFKAMTTYP